MEVNISKMVTAVCVTVTQVARADIACLLQTSDRYMTVCGHATCFASRESAQHPR